MAIQPGVWGIDLGQCALKALRVENIDGQVTATAFDYVEHPKILSQPDADPDQLTREALEKFLSRNTIRGDTVVISIPGQSGLARFVKLPPVEEKKITDIVRFEAKQQIPFNLDEVVWDYQKLGSGVVTDGFAMETEIGLFAIKKETVNRYLDHFKEAGVEVHIVQMAPLALCNFVSYDLLESTDQGAEDDENAGKKRCVVALDIGADNSNLVITDGQRIIWQRPIPLGGNHFTRVLTKDLKLTFAKAEHVKRNAIKSADLKQILSSLKPVLNDFVGEVQRSLGYFTNTHRDAHVQYMMGLGNAFRLPGLQKFLGEKLQLDVRKLQKLERLTGDSVVSSPVYTENVLSFAVAYGLALQGLKVSRLHTNLLPQDIQVERTIRAKKPWAVTAAAALLLGTGVLAAGYELQYRAVASAPVKTAMKEGDKVKGTYDGFEQKVKSIKEQIDKDGDAVKSIVIGQDERLNWLRFNQFVNYALPKPDASNLSAEARAEFWNKPTIHARALAACKHFEEMQKGTGATDASAADEGEWRDDLIQANVESVYCVWCPNLPGYLEKLKTDQVARHETLSEKDAPKDDFKDGWLVEVRGYTYHHGGLEFLKKAVVDNFARLGVKKDSATTAPVDKGPAPGAQSAATQPPNRGGAEVQKLAVSAPTTTPPGSPQGKAEDGTAQADSKEKTASDPVWNRVSHVVLYDYKPEEDPDPDQLSVAGTSVVDKLNVGEATEGATGTVMSFTPLIGPNNDGGGVSSSPSQLGGFGSPGGAGSPGGSVSGVRNKIGTGGMGGPGGRNMGGPGGSGRKPTLNVPGTGVPGTLSGNRGGSPSTTTPADPQKAKKGSHTRTEFVVLFIWREPRPSDRLLPKIPAGEQGATGGTGKTLGGLGGMNMGGSRK